MGTSVPAMKDLRHYFETIGPVSLSLLGLGMMLGVISYYIWAAQNFSCCISGAPAGVWANQLLGVVAATIVLFISFLVVSSVLDISSLRHGLAGARMKSGAFTKKTILMILFLAALAFILEGAGLVSWYSAAHSILPRDALFSLDDGIASIIGGVVLIIALFLSKAPSIEAKITGSIFALAFGIAAIIGIHYNLILLKVTTDVTSLNDVSSWPFSALGVLNGSYLTGAAFIIVALGFLVYLIVMKSKWVAIGYVAIFLGALIFSIGIVWDCVANLADVPTNLLGQGFWSNPSVAWYFMVMPAISLVVFVFAGFLLLAASALGTGLQVQGLVGPMMMGQPTVASAGPPTMAEGQFCPNCGTSSPGGNLYCMKCGEKLSQPTVAPVKPPTMAEGQFCPNCGTSSPGGNLYCMKCGEKLS